MVQGARDESMGEIEFSDDGSALLVKYFSSNRSAASVVVWEATGRRRVEISEHADWSYSDASLAPKGDLVALATVERVWLWGVDAASPTLVSECSERDVHPAPARVAFAENGLSLAAQCGGSIRVYRLPGPDLSATLTLPGFDPGLDGHYLLTLLFSPGSDELLTFTQNDTAEVGTNAAWDLGRTHRLATPLADFGSHTLGPPIAISPDLTTALITSSRRGGSHRSSAVGFGERARTRGGNSPSCYR